MPDLPDYRALTQQTAQRYGIPQSLFVNQIGAESNFDPQAQSPAGAQGLGQLMPGTAAGLGVSDPFDPAANLDGAARYLQQQFQRFGRWDLALAAYNAGPGAVEKYGGIPPYEETQSYVAKILGASTSPSAGAQVAGGGVDAADAPPPAIPQESKPSLGMSMRDVLDFASPSPAAVGILGRLGETSKRVASTLSQSEIPLPGEPITKTITKIPTGSQESGKEVIDLGMDFDGALHPNSEPIVAQAMAYLGTPYLWGGADPRKGFDCSGFVQYLYRQMGIDLPRTTYEQVKQGDAVQDPADLQAGDLLFFRPGPKGPEHEGLYIGGGQFIHAPRTGDVVKISSLAEPYYTQQFMVGRRISPGGRP